MPLTRLGAGSFLRLLWLSKGLEAWTDVPDRIFPGLAGSSRLSGGALEREVSNPSALNTRQCLLIRSVRVTWARTIGFALF